MASRSGNLVAGLALSYDALQNDAAAIQAYEGALGDPTLATASRDLYFRTIGRRFNNGTSTFKNAVR